MLFDNTLIYERGDTNGLGIRIKNLKNNRRLLYEKNYSNIIIINLSFYIHK